MKFYGDNGEFSGEQRWKTKAAKLKAMSKSVTRGVLMWV